MIIITVIKVIGVVGIPTIRSLNDKGNYSYRKDDHCIFNFLYFNEYSDVLKS